MKHLLKRLIVVLIALMCLSGIAEEAQWVDFATPTVDTEFHTPEDWFSEALRERFCSSLLGDAGLRVTDVTLGILPGDAGLLVACNREGRLTEVLYYLATGTASYWNSEYTYSEALVRSLMESSCSDNVAIAILN